MARMISVHEYELRPGTDPERFEQILRDAEALGLFDLPGLVSHHLVKGVKGVRRDAYAAIWVYESREVWERLWGTPEHPKTLAEYPEQWGFGKISSCCQSSVLTPTRSGSPRTRSYNSARTSQISVNRPSAEEGKG